MVAKLFFQVILYERYHGHIKAITQPLAWPFYVLVKRIRN